MTAPTTHSLTIERDGFALQGAIAGTGPVVLALHGLDRKSTR